MTVKIEMEMPKACRGCRGLFGFWCLLKNQEPTIIKKEHLTKKPNWCPLREVNNEFPRNSACFDCALTTTCLWLKKNGPCYSCGSKKVKE